MAGMDTTADPIDVEISRIEALPPAERPAALEALEARLRSALDELASA